MSELDMDRAKAFGGKMLNILTSSVLNRMVEIGYRTGLFEAAAGGAATSAGLSARAGLNERYVREWLGAMTTGGFFSYDPASGEYTLPPEHAMFLTGEKATNVAPMAGYMMALTEPMDSVVRCFREGGGVPYSEFTRLVDTMRDSWRRVYDEHLVSGFLGAVPGLNDRLREGIDVVDLGCGAGYCLNLLAAEFPNSRFTGFDFSEQALGLARGDATSRGLTNVSFEMQDTGSFSTPGRFDLVMSIDAIHDQVKPDGMLRGACEALKPGGLFFAVEFDVSSNLENNLENPYAPMLYGVSTMHCMTVSLSANGTGLGTAWGKELAERMLKEAGFTSVEFFPCPRPQNCIIVSRK